MSLESRIRRLEGQKVEVNAVAAGSNRRRESVVLQGLMRQPGYGAMANRVLDALCHEDKAVRDSMLAEEQRLSDEFVAIAMSDATELPPHLADRGLSLEAFRAFMRDVEEAERREGSWQ